MLSQFNPGKKSWRMYTKELTSISGDNLTVIPYDGKDLILEVSSNNQIIFKKGDISYNFEDLGNIASGGVGGSSSIDITTILIGDLSLSQTISQTATSNQEESDTFYKWEQILTNNINYNKNDDEYSFRVITKGQYSLDILLRTKNITQDYATTRATFYGFVRHYNHNGIFHDYILQGNYYKDDENDYDSLAIGGQIILNLEKNDYFKIGIRTMDYNALAADISLSKMYSKMRIEKFVYTKAENLTIGDDVSFTNVDISGTLKLNNIDISDRLNNIDTSLNNLSDNLSTIGNDPTFNNVICRDLTIDNDNDDDSINIYGSRIRYDIDLVGTTSFKAISRVVAKTQNSQNSSQTKQIVHQIRSNFDGTDDLQYRIKREGSKGDKDQFDVNGFDTIKFWGSTSDNNHRGFQVYAKARFHNGGHFDSDDRLKFNERSINNSLNIIRQLNPLIYERSDNFNDASNLLYTEAGLIAQDILEISDLSYCVIGGDYYDISNNLIQNAYALEYNNIFIYNIAATKELDAIVQVQETKISNLEAENTLLKSKLNEILIEMGKETI